MDEILPPEVKEKVRKYAAEMKNTTRVVQAEEYSKENTDDTDLPF